MFLSIEDARKINDTHSQLALGDKIPGGKCGIIESDMVCEAITIVETEERIHAYREWDETPLDDEPLKDWEIELLGSQPDWTTNYPRKIYYNDEYYGKLYDSWRNW